MLRIYESVGIEILMSDQKIITKEADYLLAFISFCSLIWMIIANFSNLKNFPLLI